MGGSETDPGIFINWSLRLGTTASRCITFNKFWPISRDLVFDIRIIELWVVNEVFMKKKQISKRDFYSTVVMWNKIGRQKAKEDKRTGDCRDCCCHNEINTISEENHCSNEQIHETDERHFEPSNTSLTGINNNDDELLMAIKNRLAGLPSIPGPLSLKPEAKLQVINRQLPVTSTKPQYLANRQLSKPRKAPTQASTQVDDNMIIELKNQGTSTSHIKVASRCTQSGIGLASQIEGTDSSRHSTSRMQRTDEGYQRSLPHNCIQNTQLCQASSRIPQSDEQNYRPLQPRRNSFPNHTKQRLPSPVISPQTNYVEPPAENRVIRNSIESANQYSLPDPSMQSELHVGGLPEVPDFYGMSSQRPSVTRSVRSSIDETSYNQQVRELSWSNNTNTRAILPYQQQLVRAAANRGDTYEDRNLKPPYENVLRDQERYSTNRSIESDHQSIQDGNRGNSQTPDNNSLKGSLKDPSDRGSPNARDESTKHRVRLESDMVEHRSPPLEEQTVLTVNTQKVESGQLCKCGSKELNLICCCKKSSVREEIIKTAEGFRECRCPRNCDGEDMSNNKKNKKDKKGKADKEAKAEEKRRKKEEKELQKKERARQKAKEKEEKKKSKSKGGKKSKKKGDKECRMCTCCKCCGDAGETMIAPSETSCDSEKSKKKSKKEKKPKEKKEKKTKTKNKEKPDECSNQPPRSCECPPTMQTDLDDACRMTQVRIQEEQVQSRQLKIEEPNVLGFCNNLDTPCPALANRDRSQVRVQSRKSVMIPPNSENCCGDPVCNNGKRSCGEASKNFRSCCCSKVPGPCSVNVCSYNVNMEQPNYFRTSTSTRGNSPTAQNRFSQSSNRTSPTRRISADSMRDRQGQMRDITAAPALIFPNEVGHGDTVEVLPYSGTSRRDPCSTPLPNGFSSPDNILIDLSRKGPENSSNKRYVPPCVLYLDCTKVKDLCVIIKDKYEDPS